MKLTQPFNKELSTSLLLWAAQAEKDEGLQVLAVLKIRVENRSTPGTPELSWRTAWEEALRGRRPGNACGMLEVTILTSRNTVWWARASQRLGDGDLLSWDVEREQHDPLRVLRRQMKVWI